jgi:hypothetical protein
VARSEGFRIVVDGQHMLVTFAGHEFAGDVVARRWRDPSGAWSLALNVASSRRISAARANIVESPSNWFLESERFDRVGVRGRLPF